MSHESLCCLHLAFPRSLEQEVIALCHAVTGLSGFTIVSASGHGAGATLHTAAEVVQGCADRGLLMTVARLDDLRCLLGLLRDRMPAREVAYWISPVLEIGRLAS
ncbi:MAG: DUF3240 family protein [Proteobacteria bacterium]|nr:DUF3240 family protein [Pseudomonadota bacterium]